MIPHSLLVLTRNALPFLANHLWQSTLVALVAWVLSLAFRKNDARVRFGLWLTASMKFLIPFSWLIALGNRLVLFGRSSGGPATVYQVVEQVGQPFTRITQTEAHSLYLTLLPVALTAVWLLGTIAVLGSWALRWRRVAAVVRQAKPLAEGREVDALRRLEKGVGIQRPTPLMLSRGSMEPGIFGIFRPVLVLPEGISGHLSEAHLRAILAHELWHVRRRDNLAASLHMLVEATFWFHPLVWWIGARLVEERERACDEQVLQLGSQPEIYAESLLKACRFCVESPLPCVSGVAGSNLKRRVTHIMNFQTANHLTFGRKLLLTAIGSAAVTGPVVFGAMHAPQLYAQTTYTASMPKESFQTASIKPRGSSNCMVRLENQPGHFIGTEVTVKSLIEFAYGIDDYQLTGGPDWINTDCYDVDATWNAAIAAKAAMPPGPPPPPPPAGGLAMEIHPLRPGQVQAMMITLLKERFNLELKSESRELPIYELVVGSSGARLTATPTSPPPPNFNGEPIMGVKTLISVTGNEVSLTNGPVSLLAGFLSQTLHHKVVDKTGLKGPYDMTLHIQPGQDSPDAISDSLQEQFGLRLESAQGPVNVFAVDQVEKPADN